MAPRGLQSSQEGLKRHPRWLRRPSGMPPIYPKPTARRLQVATETPRDQHPSKTQGAIHSVVPSRLFSSDVFLRPHDGSDVVDSELGLHSHVSSTGRSHTSLIKATRLASFLDGL
eukprot:6892205-Pyramimonas_sp.AAC.1